MINLSVAGRQPKLLGLVKDICQKPPQKSRWVFFVAFYYSSSSLHIASWLLNNNDTEQFCQMLKDPSNLGIRVYNEESPFFISPRDVVDATISSLTLTPGQSVASGGKWQRVFTTRLSKKKILQILTYPGSFKVHSDIVRCVQIGKAEDVVEPLPET